MNTTSDFDRRASAYLTDGPTELSGRVLDAALREVHQTRQRRRGLAPWRFQQMLSIARVGAVAVVALLALGATLIGVTSPNPSPSPTPTSTVVPPSPRACLVTPVDRQLLAADCTYNTEILGISITIKGTGSFQIQYAGEPDRIIIQGIDAISGGSAIEIVRVRSLPASPCADDGVGLPGSAPSTVDDYLAWLRDSPLRAYPTTSVAVGGLTGRRVRIAPIPMPTKDLGEAPCPILWLAGGEFSGMSPFALGSQAIDIDVLQANEQVYLVVALHGNLGPNRQSIQAQLDGIRFQP